MTFYKIALLIDGENISPSVAAFAIQETQKFGKVVIKRVYGDWTCTRMAAWKIASNRFALVPKHVLPSVQGKNSADMALAIDAMDVLHTQPQIDGFCIVSSDSDFTGLAHRLRESSAFVMGIGRTHTALPFVRACDVFSYIDRAVDEKQTPPDELPDVEPFQQEDDIVPSEGETKEVFRTETPVLTGLKVVGKIDLPLDKRFNKMPQQPFDPQLLDEAFKAVVNERTGLALFSQIGEFLKKKHRVRPKDYGFDSFKHFLKAHIDTSIYQTVVHEDRLTYYLKRVVG